MAIEIMTAAWKVTGLSPPQKLVLLDLADTANAAGVSWPSIARISARSGLGRSTIFRILTDLEGLGYLKRNARHNQSTVYTVSIQDPVPERDLPSPTVRPTPSQSGTPPVPERDTEPSVNRQEEPSENQESLVGLHRDDMPAGLDLDSWKLWIKYRKEIAKPFRSKQTLIAQAKKLAAFGAGQMAVVRQSIDEGWQGLFPVKSVPAGGAPERLWNSETEQWESTVGMPKWKVDKLKQEAASEKAFSSTFDLGGRAPGKPDGGAGA